MNNIQDNLITIQNDADEVEEQVEYLSSYLPISILIGQSSQLKEIRTEFKKI